MPNNPKLFIRKTTIEVTFRTEEGLPLVATPYIYVIVQSILARAQSLFPVTICHFLVMANHIHMIIVVDFPDLIPRFVGHLKGEISHAVNQLLGRKKHTVWCDGYDSPRILDPEKVIERIVYIYTNPQKAGLVKCIEDYPQYSSWQAFLDGGAEVELYRIPRDAVPEIPRASLSLSAQQELAKEFLQRGQEETSLFINPDAWMECFSDFIDADPHLVKEEIIRLIREKEEFWITEHKGQVLGAHALRLESIRKDHTPKKRGRRMICLSSLKMLRMLYIAWFKERCAEASAWYVQWLAGNTRANPPPGMFAPGGGLFANLNPALVPV